MSNSYRLNVRFDLDIPREQKVADYLRQLNAQNHKSMNRFIVDAVCNEMDNVRKTFDFSLEDIRDVIHDELGRAYIVSSGGNIQPIPFTPDEPGMGRAEIDAAVLEDLSLFGC